MRDSPTWGDRDAQLFICGEEMLIIHPNCISSSHHGKLSYGRNPLLAHDNRYATLGKRNADRTIQPRRHHTAAENAKDPLLPPFSLIRDFRRQNTRGNVSKISVNHACYRQIGSKSTNHSPLAWRKEGQKVTLVVVIGGFRSDLSITRMIDGNFGNVSAGVLILKVAYQGKRW